MSHKQELVTSCDMRIELANAQRMEHVGVPLLNKGQKVSILSLVCLICVLLASMRCWQKRQQPVS